jgi:4'-phosphopantetheinyl transferase
MFVDVWWIPLNMSAIKGPELDSALSLEERQRAARFQFPEHATRFRLRHVALRSILARYVEQPPWEIELVTDARGKPRLAGDASVRFNLSHTGDVALLAVAPMELGIDVETVRVDLPVEDIARFFTQVERETLREASPGEARARAFFRLWTRKEAVLKADGSGLSSSLDSLNISRCPPGLVRFPPDRENWWRVEDLNAESGYVAALAAPPGEWVIRYYCL